MKRILADVDRCSGCRLCEVVCSFVHEKEFRPSASRVTIVKEDFVGFDLPVLCWHCDPCSATENCAAKALRRNASGLVSLDEEKCTGCGTCVQHCPLNAIKLHPEKRTPLICDQCNGRPACVEECPTEALTYTDGGPKQPTLSHRVLEETLRRWRVTV